MPETVRSATRSATVERTTMPNADGTAVADAVAAARRAFPGWRDRSVRERVRVLRRFRTLAFEARARIAALVHEETGKPLAEGLVADVAMALEGARFLSAVAERTLAPSRRRSGVLAAWRKRIVVHHDPYGVVAVIGPWNYPFFFPAMHVMTALVAGNAVVLKPSEHSPRSAALLVELLHAAGVPRDVLHVVQGAGATGAALVAADVDKVFFTGSERTGRAIASACAPRLLPVSLELGGSDAAVVLADAPLATTASGIAWGRFANAGQTCAAVKRVIALDAVHDALVERLVGVVSSLRTDSASGTDVAGERTDGADVGPLISAAQRQTLQTQLEDAVARGAQVAIRRETRAADPSRAAPLVILTGVTPAMRVWHEETFGPVLAVARARDEGHAVELANATRYGLSASVWTSNAARGAAIAARMEAGAVVINDSVIAAGLPEVPHGGVKDSGIGRIHGIEGLRECVRTRTVIGDLLPNARQPWWFGYGRGAETGIDAYLRLAHAPSLRGRLAGIRGTLRLMLRPERPL